LFKNIHSIGFFYIFNQTNHKNNMVMVNILKSISDIFYLAVFEFFFA
jgi:hypothetical protein